MLSPTNLSRLIVKHPDTANPTILPALAAGPVVIIHYNGFSLRVAFQHGSKIDQIANFVTSQKNYSGSVTGFDLNAELEETKNSGNKSKARFNLKD